MNNKTIAAITTGFVLGILFAPAPGHKSRKRVADIYCGLNKKLNSWFAKKDKTEIDIVTLKQEIAQIEDKLSLKSKVQLNTLLEKASKNLN